MKLSTRRAPSAARLAALIAAGLALGVSQHAMAATASGVIISNKATLEYAVGSVQQAVIESSETGNATAGLGNGTATTFKVDNKVDLTLTETSTTFTSVSPGSVKQVTAFSLSNLGNTAQGYSLTAANVSATVFGTTDSFDVTGIEIHIDANGNGILDPAESAVITSLASVPAGATVKLLVVADVPAGQANGSQAAVSLTAVTRAETTLTALSETANTQNGVEIVFADSATTANVSGTDPGQTARDATAFAYDAYRVAAAIISVSKTATVICDPFNGSTNPKNIPGAIVRWTITVSNGGTAGASATLNQVTDSLDPNTAHDPNLVTGLGAPATATSCTSANGAPESLAGRGFQIESSATRALGGTGGYMTTTAADSDGASITGQNVTIDFAAALPADVPNSHAAGELKAGESATVTFNVTIN